jgi:putative alpha-1,2-mannosidase
MPHQSILMFTKRLIPLYCVCLLLAAQPASRKEPVDYVNPNIGTIGHLLTATVPYVQYPHGMARVAPVTTPGFQDRYLADKIFGFPAGPATVMAYTGDLCTIRLEALRAMTTILKSPPPTGTRSGWTIRILKPKSRLANWRLTTDSNFRRPRTLTCPWA